MTLRAHLRTARLVLRPLIPDDAPVLAGALNDFAISQWLTMVPFPYTLADAEWFIREGQFAVGHVWAICDESGPVGVISIGKEFGYWLARRVWRRGYATEAGRAVVAEWFRDPEAGDLLSAHYEGNTASRNVLTKLGFIETHRGTTHSLSRGADVESAKMRLTRQAFAAISPLVIRTERLVLRPVAASDEAAVVACLNDIAVSGWLAVVPYPYNPADFQYFQCQYAVPGETFAVDDAQGFVGIVGVEDRTLGYWFAPASHGNGYATEAARAALAAHFAENPVDIASGYFEGNARSANVLRKLGFKETGRGMKHCRALGHDRPHVDMVLTCEAFAAANPLVIETDRLVLRPLRETDASDLRRIVTIPDVGRMLLIFPPDWTEDAARAFTHTWRWKGDAMFRLAITRKGKDRLIGTIGIRRTPGEAEAAIFYFLDPAEAGNGFASEVLTALLPELARRFGPLPLVADVFTDNPPSARVLEKSGFIRTGTGMGTSAARLEPAPIWLYRLDPQLPEADR